MILLDILTLNLKNGVEQINLLAFRRVRTILPGEVTVRLADPPQSPRHLPALGGPHCTASKQMVKIGPLEIISQLI